MANIWKTLQSRWVIFMIVAIGLDLRLGLASLGHNYEIESWYIVADILRHGGNVYAETVRYNYGPVWFLILHGLDGLAGHNHEVLRYLIAGFLSLADLGIFWFLWRRVGRLAATLFFLNPISMIVTGYCCQFDNLAILLGLASVHLFGDDFEKPLNRRRFLALLLLGLSLMTKHDFFLFPIWLAVKQKGFWQKMTILSVPTACFLLGFAPFWAVGREGIIQNVFGYQSWPGGFFYNSFVPACIQYCFDRRTFWYLLLVLFAFFCRTRKSFESLLIYTGVLVGFSSATGNQYLAIPLALAAVYPNMFFVCYTALGTFHLCADVRYGPRLWAGMDEDCNRYAVLVLCLAVFWLLWRDHIRQAIQRIKREIQIPLDLMKSPRRNPHQDDESDRIG